MNAATWKASAFAVNLAVHGVDVTVRRGSPAAPIPTRAIWLTGLLNEQGPAGSDFQKYRTRGLLSVPRVAAGTWPGVGWLERDEVIEAPPATGGAAIRWRVDAVDQFDADHIRVIVRDEASS